MMIMDALSTALRPVLDDVEHTGLALPRITAWDRSGLDQPAAMLWDDDGSGSSVSLDPDETPAEQSAAVADQVQDWIIEHHWWRGTSTWPPCGRHPAAHPLRAVVHDGSAVWQCPVDDQVVATIGSLGARTS